MKKKKKKKFWLTPESVMCAPETFTCARETFQKCLFIFAFFMSHSGLRMKQNAERFLKQVTTESRRSKGLEKHLRLSIR